jgi:preprotein translocase subunit SecF
VELFKNISINWLNKKWWFFGFSWVLIVLGVIGYFIRGGLTYGIDFTGGTVIQLKFNQKPDLDLIRKSLKPETSSPPLIQAYGPAEDNAVQVRMQTAISERQDTAGHKELMNLLRKSFDPEHISTSLIDFNNVGLDALNKALLSSDPDNLRGQSKTTQEIDDYYSKLAQKFLDYRNKDSKGLVQSLDNLKNVFGTSNSVISEFKKNFYAGPFAVKGVETVGAVVGADLRRRAGWAVGLSFLGMLIYIGWRFKPIYGLAAIVALIHDLAVTLGLFALTGKEISLTVIAALLTLVGYSMNDTIVVFDRTRENLRLMKKESLTTILNVSINQTFTRTIMASGTTFISVLTLWALGGEVLNGFAFALTIGILIGTYSSIGIASPIVEWWANSRGQQKSNRKTN